MIPFVFRPASRVLLNWIVCFFCIYPSAILPQSVRKLGTIMGTATDAQGRPLVGAKVGLNLTRPDSVLKVAETAANGTYAFANIGYGSYDIVAKLSGYLPYTVHAVRLESQALVIDLKLKQRHDSVMSNAIESKDQLGLVSQKPSFVPAGVRGSTTAGGYSAAAEAEGNAAVMNHVAGLGREDLSIGTASKDIVDCTKETALLKRAHMSPTSYDANHEIGLFYLKHGDVLRSIRYLQLAWKASPTSRDNTRYLASAYMANGQYFEAIYLLEKLAVARAKDVASDRLLAEAYIATNQPGKALSLFERASKLDAGEANAYQCGIGMILAGFPHNAEKIFMSALSDHPTSARLRFGLGIAEYLQDNRMEAIHSMLWAVDADPEFLPPYSLLANCSGISKNTDIQIDRRLKHYMFLHPNEADAHYNYALALWNEDRHTLKSSSTAIIESQLKRAIEINPKLAEAHFQLGVVYANSNDYSDAVKELENVVRLDPNNAEAHYRLSQAYIRVNQKYRADRELKTFELMRSEQAKGKSGLNAKVQKLASNLASKDAVALPCPHIH